MVKEKRKMALILWQVIGKIIRNIMRIFYLRRTVGVLKEELRV